MNVATAADLPPPPTGYRLAAPVGRVWVTDPSGQPVPGFSFAEPYTLSLRYNNQDVAESDRGRLAIGFLGETSSTWAILESEQEATTATLVARPRRPGAFGVLVPVTAPAATQPAAAAKPVGSIAPVAVVVVALALVIVLLALRRRRAV